MRRLAAIVLVACSASLAAQAPPLPPAPVLPPPLHRLTLAQGSDEITPVTFDHARHAAESACARCHHEGSEDRARLPARCRTCHPLHAEEGKPPDL